MKNDLNGKRFGRLTVLAFAERKNSRNMWLCRCECGNEKIIREERLLKNETTSCGCKRKEILLHQKHGLSRSRIYNVWAGMIKRCHLKCFSSFEHYGGKGISVCDEWRKDFQAFYDWAISHGYEEGLTIDRIDNNGNYEPSNCRWASKREQANNRSTSVFVTVNGETHTLAEWARIKNLDYHLLWNRYSKGWQGEKLFKKKRG